MGIWLNKPVHVTFAEDLPKGTIRTTTYIGYVDNKGQLWEAPIGTVTDGASIPKAFWWVIGSPINPEYIEASIIHDLYCHNITRPSKAVHAVFEEMLTESKDVPKWKRKVMSFAVKVFGPRFELQS